MDKRNIFLDKSFLSGILIGCFGGCMAVTTRLNRGIYPLAVFLLMVIIGAILAAGSFRGKSGSLPEKASRKELLMIILLFISPVFARQLGFYLCGYLVIAGISWLTSPEKNLRMLARVLIYSLFVTAAAYVVFTLLLKINTPKGILL